MKLALLMSTLFLNEMAVKDRDTAWKVSQTAIVAMESTYRFDRLKSKVEETKPHLRKVTLGMMGGQPRGTCHQLKKPFSKDLPLPKG